jgi:glycosyltransferase involved in cell wall biosynthesis
MIDIAMVSCNRARITGIAIDELKKRTTTPHRLIVLDNGSEDNSPELLKWHYDQGNIDILLLFKENTGIHWAHNRLLDMVESKPYYISTDNDLVPCVPIDENDWLSRLIDLAQRNPDYGAIACRPPDLVGAGGGIFDDAPEVRFMRHCGAHLRIMPTADVKATGWKREKRPARNNEEKTICTALEKRGLKAGYATHIHCIHLFGELDQGEDGWGYPADHDHKARGHRDMWPPAEWYGWKNRGVDWETCKRPGE